MHAIPSANSPKRRGILDHEESYPRFCRLHTGGLLPPAALPYRHLSRPLCCHSGRRFVACRVLSGIARTAATRFNLCARVAPLTHAKPTRLAPSCTLAWPNTLLCSPVGSCPTLSPLTTCVRTPSSYDGVAGLLSVAVVVACTLRRNRPHLLFRVATFADCSGEHSWRESGSSSANLHRQRRRFLMIIFYAFATRANVTQTPIGVLFPATTVCGFLQDGYSIRRGRFCQPAENRPFFGNRVPGIAHLVLGESLYAQGASDREPPRLAPFTTSLATLYSASGCRGPSIHTAPSRPFSCFQMGTTSFSRSIAY
jgi:hypothetical protein